MMEHDTDRAGDLEVQDDGPDQAQGQLGVAVCDVIVPDVHQLDLWGHRENTEKHTSTPDNDRRRNGSR